MNPTTPWGANGFESNVLGTLANFQDSVPVQLIATRRSDFKTCRPDENPSTVVDRNRADRFDFLPVVDSDTEGSAAILGIFETTAQAPATPGHTVRDLMHPLGEKHLIGADASILTFIYDADQHPFRFVVAGREISGLVTLSDLQQLPVRAAIFAVVTHLEMIMADAIRSHCPKRDTWMDLLPPKRRAMVLENLQQAKSEDTLVDPLLYTQFCDKVTIISKSWRPSPSGLLSKTTFHKDMGDAQSLRNHLSHANNYAATRDAAKDVCETVRKIARWVAFMAEWRADPLPAQPWMASKGA